MASSYSTRLRIELIGTGEQSSTWGDTTNRNLGTLLETSIAGVASVYMTDANYTLTAYDGVSDEARNMVLELNGALTANRNVICPTQQKLYVVSNKTSGSQAIVLKTSSGTGITVPSGTAMILYCDGVNVVNAITNLASGTSLNGEAIATVTGVQTLTNKTLTSPTINSPTISTATLNGTTTVVTLSVTGNTTLGDTSADTITLLGTVQPGIIISGSSSTPALRITQTGSGNALTIEDDTNPDSTPFIIDQLGHVGLGVTSVTAGIVIDNEHPITGAGNAVSTNSAGLVQSDVTVSATNFKSQIYTAATAFTLPIYSHYTAANGGIGAGSAVTTQYGFRADTLTQATNNYGFYGDVTSGTNNYNLYMNSAAKNYIKGVVGIGTNDSGGAFSPSTLMHLSSSASAASAGSGSTIRLEYTNTGVLANDIYGQVEWYGNDASTSANGVRARMRAFSTDTLGATDLRFAGTTSTSTAITDRLFVRANDTYIPSNTTTTAFQSDGIVLVDSVFRVGQSTSENGVQVRQAKRVVADTTGSTYTLLSGATSGNTSVPTPSVNSTYVFGFTQSSGVTTSTTFNLNPLLGPTPSANTYFMIDVDMVGVYTTTGDVFASRIQKRWTVNGYYTGAAWTIEGLALIGLGFTSDATNLVLGTANATRGIIAGSGANLQLAIANRTTPAASSITYWNVRIDIRALNAVAAGF